MENNIKLISQVLASFQGNLQQHQDIQKAWQEVVSEVSAPAEVKPKDESTKKK